MDSQSPNLKTVLSLKLIFVDDVVSKYEAGVGVEHETPKEGCLNLFILIYVLF